KHGKTELGAYMHTCPAPSEYQNDPGPTGCAFLRIGELAEREGYSGPCSGASVDPPITLTRTFVDEVSTATCLIGRDAAVGRPSDLRWRSMRAPAPARDWLYCCEYGRTAIPFAPFPASAECANSKQRRAVMMAARIIGSAKRSKR